MIYFDKVEVVNQLDASKVYGTIKNYTVEYDQTWIFDKVHHEVSFCLLFSLVSFLYKFESLFLSIPLIKTTNDFHDPTDQSILFIAYTSRDLH